MVSSSVVLAIFYKVCISDSATYVVTAPCISRDSDLAQCSYQSNQFNQSLSWQHAMLVYYSCFNTMIIKLYTFIQRFFV